MAHEFHLVDEFLKTVVQLAERYRLDAAKSPQRRVHTGIDRTSGVASSSQLINYVSDIPIVAPEYSNLSDFGGALVPQAIYDGDGDISFDTDYDFTNATLHGPSPELLYFPLDGNLQPLGTISSGERSGGGLEATSMAHDDVQFVEAHSSQAPTALEHLVAGNVPLDELYPDHERDNSTIFEWRYDLYDRYTPGSSVPSSKPIFYYRLDSTQLSEDDTHPQGELRFWTSAQDGRSVVNAKGVRLRYSKYLPVTVATSIEGWQLELIMRRDRGITYKDFYDRMPVFGPHSRPTIHGIKSRRASARTKYIFRELNDPPAISTA